MTQPEKTNDVTFLSATFEIGSFIFEGVFFAMAAGAFCFFVAVI